MATKTVSAGYRWIVMVLCFLVLTAGYAYMSIWSMIINDIMAEFNISSSTAQLGNSLLLAGYAVSSYVLALAASKIGQKKACTIGLLLFCVGTFAIPFVHSFALILAFRFLQGCGIVWGLAVGLAVAWSPAKSRGLASGLVGGGLCVGTGFGGWYAATLWASFPAWRDTFLYGGIIFAIFIVLFIIFAKDAPKDLYPEDAIAAPEETSASSGSTRSVWTIPAAWLCALALFCICWEGVGFQALLPQFCYDLGYGMTDAGNALLIGGILGIVLTPLGGIISDAFVKRGANPLKARAYTMAGLGFLPAAIAMFLCPTLATLGMVFIYIIVLLAVFRAVDDAVLLEVAERLGERFVGDLEGQAPADFPIVGRASLRVAYRPYDMHLPTPFEELHRIHQG